MAGYGDDDGFEAWMEANGYALPSGSPEVAVLRNRGANYLDGTYGPRLSCSSPTGGLDQERAWPRTGHYINCTLIPDDAIPAAWVRASYRAAWLEASSPGSLAVTVDPNRRVKRQKVDVIEREFFDGGSSEAGSAGAVIDSEIDGMVQPFLCGSFTLPAIMVV